MEPKSPSHSADWKSFFGAAPMLAVLPLLTAALLCASLTTEWGTGLCYVALVPFAYVLIAPSIPRATYAAAYLAGLAVHLVGMSWMLDCYRYENSVGPYAVPWFWIGTWGGILFVALFALGRIIAARWRLPMTVLLPLLWVTYEFIRHEVAELMSGTGFPWLKLGTALVDNHTLVQIADLGGEYLLSFLLAMISGTLVDLALALSPNRAAKIWPILVSCFVLIASTGYGHWRNSQSPGSAGPTVVLMGELDLPPLLPPKRLQEATGTRHADLLLWPELAYHHTIQDPPMEDSARCHLTHSAQELDCTLVIGCERARGASRYNSLACADPVEGFQGCYDKINLVPGAEASMHRTALVDANNFSYQRGQDLRVFRLPTETRVYCFAPAICYDICFGQHFRKSRTQDIDFLVQSGAEGQDKSDEVARLMLRYARLRAIENRRALVRNATFGYSGLIDGNGVVQVALTTDPITSPTWLGVVPIDTRWSFYSYWGDWIAFSSCFAIVILALGFASKPE